jgi:Transglutaminase-like superfamily
MAMPNYLKGMTLERVWHIAVASVALARARLEIYFRSPAGVTAKLRRGFGRLQDQALSPTDEAWLERTAWAIQGVGRRLPWRSDCLVRVLAADWLVRRRGLEPQIFMQAGRLADGRFEAHAWLNCCGREITGGPSSVLQELTMQDR